jgi:chromosome segregation ATPase
MGQDPSQGRTTVEGEQPTPEELRQEIAQTREELGDTAAALASKTDVKARAKDKVEDLKQTAAEKAESIKDATAEKKDAAFSSTSTGETATNPGLSAKASSVATQAKTKAQENPALVATAMAFLGGFLLGRRGPR